jgi:hypothetical protein
MVLGIMIDFEDRDVGQRYVVEMLKFHSSDSQTGDQCVRLIYHQLFVANI